MNLDDKLLVCETMLARLDDAMTTAEAEARQSSALQDHLRRLLDNLDAEQAKLDQTIETAIVEGEGADPEPRPDGAEVEALPNLHERLARIRTVQERLHLVLVATDGVSAQHP